MVALLAGGLMLAMPACGDDETGEASGGEGCVDYSGVSGSASFADDVMPIFQQACNFTACHATEDSSGNPVNAMEDLGLGPVSMVTPTADHLSAVHSAIVGAGSNQSSLSMVAAGDPGASWLLVKVEYDDLQACSTNGCESGCGDRMPLNSMALSTAQLDVLRQWIADGAQNN